MSEVALGSVFGESALYHKGLRYPSAYAYGQIIVSPPDVAGVFDTTVTLSGNTVSIAASIVDADGISAITNISVIAGTNSQDFTSNIARTGPNTCLLYTSPSPRDS